MARTYREGVNTEHHQERDSHNDYLHRHPHTFDLTCTLLVTCAVEHVGYVVGGHGLGVELSAGQSDGDVLQGA